MIPEATLEHVLNHGVIAYPTSTLPGLACLPTIQGLDALFTLKQRSSDKPVSLGVLSLDQASELVQVPDLVRRIEDAFPQGAFTFILPAHQALDPRLGGERVAVRCLAHPIARLLVESVGPITATSANESGETPADDARIAGQELGLPDHAILPGGCPGGRGSTILNVQSSGAGWEVSIMREGIIPTHDVAEWLKNPN
jgi:L-threonylcarbamoyladenylate synthase